MKREDVLLLVESLRKLCVIVTGIADVVMEKLAPSEEFVTVDAVEKQEPKKLAASKKKAKAEPVKDEPAAAEEAKTYTKEEVRQILADKARKGFDHRSNPSSMRMALTI